MKNYISIIVFVVIVLIVASFLLIATEKQAIKMSCESKYAYDKYICKSQIDSMSMQDKEKCADILAGSDFVQWCTQSLMGRRSISPFAKIADVISYIELKMIYDSALKDN